MQTPIPYMVTVKNLAKIMAAMQKAATPETFTVDFVKDLGFTSSSDRGVTRVLRYIGFLDPSGKPTSYYREFMDKQKAGKVLARRLMAAFDDLFTSDREAYAKSSESLKGWFKTKTGQGDAVAKKIATTFKTLADLADFKNLEGSLSDSVETQEPKLQAAVETIGANEAASAVLKTQAHSLSSSSFGLVYRVEIHLPDTQNVDTFRAIFKALREELS